MEEQKTVKLDGEEITMEQLNEKRRNLPNGLRIVETASGVYTTLTKLNG